MYLLVVVIIRDVTRAGHLSRVTRAGHLSRVTRTCHLSRVTRAGHHLSGVSRAGHLSRVTRAGHLSRVGPLMYCLVHHQWMFFHQIRLSPRTRTRGDQNRYFNAAVNAAVYAGDIWHDTRSGAIHRGCTGAGRCDTVTDGQHGVAVVIWMGDVLVGVWRRVWRGPSVLVQYLKLDMWHHFHVHVRHSL